MSDQAAATVHPPRPTHRFLWAAIVVLLGVIAASIYVNAQTDAKPARAKLALVTWNEDSFWDPVVTGAQDAAEQNNVELTVIRSKPDMETQSNHLRDLLSKGVAGIAISPNNPAAQAGVLNEAAKKAALITFDADAPDSDRRLFVGIDNYGAGHLAAEEVRTALPDGGAVIISVGSIDMQNGRDRRQGLIDSLLDRPFKRDRAADPIEATLAGTKYSIASTVIDGGDTAKASAQLADALRKHPEAKCIVGLFSYSGPAALAAIESAGRTGAVQVIGFDETEATQAAIEAGTIHSSILQDQYRCGHEAIRLLADAVRGGDVGGPNAPRTINVQTLVLRKDNLEELRETRQIRRPAGAKPTTQPS